MIQLKYGKTELYCKKKVRVGQQEEGVTSQPSVMSGYHSNGQEQRRGVLWRGKVRFGKVNKMLGRKNGEVPIEKKTQINSQAEARSLRCEISRVRQPEMRRVGCSK